MKLQSKILAIVCAIAIFIPSLVAIISYNNTNKAPVSDKNVRVISVSDLAGKEFSFEKGKSGADNDVIELFLTMNETAEKVSSLPDPLIGTPFFKVTMSSAQKKADYQYYFSTDATEAYYLNEAGEAYRIEREYAQQFIESSCAVSLYRAADVPTLLVSGQPSLVPVSAQWKYKNTSGNFVDNTPAVSQDAQTLSLEGGLDLVFSLTPDNFNVKVTDVATGEVKFNDQYDKIGALSIDKSTTLAVEITAKWYEDKSRDYFGEMNYVFTADISAPASFYLGEKEIQTGEFTVISATNVTDPTKISFTSSPDIGYTPTFFLDNGVAVALVPIRCELGAGDYNFTVKYGGVTDTLTLKVTQRSVRLFNYDVTAAILNSTRTEKTIADFKAATAEAASTASPTQLWEGLFAQPVQQKGAYDGVITTGFGHQRKILANGEIYIHEGVDYITSSGSSVFAANNGKVLFAGYTELGGNTVVIEHGYGLKSWYSHLSEIKVAVGDTVAKADVIGIAGSTGFTKQTGVHAGATVFDVPVSPYPYQDAEKEVDRGVEIKIVR